MRQMRVNFLGIHWITLLNFLTVSYAFFLFKNPFNFSLSFYAGAPPNEADYREILDSIEKEKIILNSQKDNEK